MFKIVRLFLFYCFFFFILNKQKIDSNVFICLHLILVNAMAQVGKIKRYSLDDDERELSPEEPLPLYQQRENFYS